MDSSSCRKTFTFLHFKLKSHFLLYKNTRRLLTRILHTHSHFKLYSNSTNSSTETKDPESKSRTFYSKECSFFLVPFYNTTTLQQTNQTYTLHPYHVHRHKMICKCHRLAQRTQENQTICLSLSNLPICTCIILHIVLMVMQLLCIC